MTDQQEGKIPREPREIRNTHEARDDEDVAMWPATSMPNGPMMVGKRAGGPGEPKTTTDADLAFEAGAHFLPPRAVSELIEHALPDLRRARDRIQYVPHNQRIARDIASLEELMMLLRTERHY